MRKPTDPWWHEQLSGIPAGLPELLGNRDEEWNALFFFFEFARPAWLETFLVWLTRHRLGSDQTR